jgi:CheY-like chemotaxis protein
MENRHNILSPSIHTILIVDDTPANLSVVVDYLADQGFQVSELSETNVRLQIESAEQKRSGMAIQRLNRELGAIRSCSHKLVTDTDESAYLTDISDGI